MPWATVGIPAVSWVESGDCSLLSAPCWETDYRNVVIYFYQDMIRVSWIHLSKVYILVIFSIFRLSNCNRSLPVHFHAPIKKPTLLISPFYSVPPPPALASAPLGIFLFWTFPMNRKPPSTLPFVSDFFQLARCVQGPLMSRTYHYFLLFMASERNYWSSRLCLAGMRFAFLLTDWWAVGCFHLVATVSSAAVTLMCRLLCELQRL